VVFVDQFEEVFTSSADDEERASFVETLVSAALAAPDRLAVVVALRGDFYGACARFPAFAELLAANHVPVGPMTADELRRTIELPARRAGLRVESPLIDALVEEIADEPGGLPLLSTTLVELWRQREAGWLRLEAYERSGGLRGAVARLADGTYEHLSDEERAAARRIFLRLVGPGEGEAVTRRRAPLSEFDLDRDEVAARVLQRLTTDRLLTTGSSTVEVAHEALLREWPRLRSWIEEDAQGHQLRQHLTQAARQWDASGREDSELYRGARLSATMDWSAQHDQELNDLERDFVAESRQASEREAQRMRRTNRRLRGLLVGTAAFLVIAMVAGSLALIQRSQARSSAAAADRSAAEASHSATVALSHSLAARGVSEPRLDVGMLLAAQGVRLDDSVETRGSVLSTLERSPSTIGVLALPGQGIGAMKVAASPDGRTLAVTDDQGDLRFYSVASRQLIGSPLSGIANYETSDLAFTPNGKYLIAQNESGAPEVIDPTTQRSVKSLTSTDGTQGLALSPNARIAYSQSGAYVFRWDLRKGHQLPSVLVGDGFHSLPVVAEGTGQVITATADRGGLVQLRNGQTLAVERSFHVALSMDLFTTTAVTRDGRTVALTQNGGDRSVIFLDTHTGRTTVGVGGLGGELLFSPDGRTLITNFSERVGENTVQVWNASSHTVVGSLLGQEGAINDLKFDTRGETLYSSGADGTVVAYDMTGTRGFGRSFSVGSGNPGPFPCCIPGYSFVAASSDGTRIATTQAHGVVNIVDLASHTITASFRAIPDGDAIASAFSPDGSQVAVAGEPGVVTLWQLSGESPTMIRRLEGLPAIRTYGSFGGALHFAPVPYPAFSPDGRWVAAAESVPIPGKDESGSNFVISEWNAETGAERAAQLRLKAETFNGNIEFSPDGRFIATSVDNDVVLIDTVTLSVVKRFTGDPQGVVWVEFSPRGTYLATAGWAGHVHLWRTTTWAEVGSGVRIVSGNLHNIQFDPSEQEVLVTASGGLSGLWTVPDLHRIGGPQLPHPAATSFSWSNSVLAGPSMVLVYADGIAYEWPFGASAWRAHACAVAGRNLTRDEWALYVGPDHPYAKTCPEYP
jgi:WD40 repeat protein